MAYRFEWDEAKAKSNLIRHAISLMKPPRFSTIAWLESLMTNYIRVMKSVK